MARAIHHMRQMGRAWREPRSHLRHMARPRGGAIHENKYHWGSASKAPVGRRLVGGARGVASDGVIEFEEKAEIIDGAMISTSLEIRVELIVECFGTMTSTVDTMTSRKVSLYS